MPIAHNYLISNCNRQLDQGPGTVVVGGAGSGEGNMSVSVRESTAYTLYHRLGGGSWKMKGVSLKIML